MAQAEASDIASASPSGGEDGGGTAREAQGSGGEEWVTAAEEGGRRTDGRDERGGDSEGDPDMPRAGPVVGGEGARRGSSGATWRCG